MGLGMGVGMGNIGEVMGSWVKDWKGLGDDAIAKFGDSRVGRGVAEMGVSDGRDVVKEA